MSEVEIVETKKEEIEPLSKLATSILREHYDPIIGKEQNDYMLEKFQSVKALTEQMEHGYIYYWVKYGGNNAGFMGFYPVENKLYLSKFYLAKEFRGKKLSRKMLEFLIDYSKKKGLKSIYLNVNTYNYNSIKIYEHLGFVKIGYEKKDIGKGYYMEGYVYEYNF